MYSDTLWTFFLHAFVKVSDTEEWSTSFGTDRRVPILQVSRASSSGQTDLSSYRPSIVTMVVAVMVASFPMTYFF